MLIPIHLGRFITLSSYCIYFKHLKRYYTIHYSLLNILKLSVYLEEPILK